MTPNHRIRVRCQYCRRMVHENAIGSHHRDCNQQTPKPPNAVPVGHTRCRCGHLMAMTARVCWKCEIKDDRFAELEELLKEE